MKALITGGAGLMGSTLAARRPAHWSAEVTQHVTPALQREGVKRHTVDLAQPLAFFGLAERRRPDLVIHTAYAKTEPQVTVDSTTEVASACAALDIPLVHMSTDAIFDGDHAPYAEDDPPSPIHAYGRSKATAERAVRESCPDAVIVRNSLIVAADGSDGPSAWAIERLRAGERVTFFDDEYRQPILAEDLADQIWEIAQMPLAERSGVWHLPGPERMSRADIGRWLCDRFGLDPALVDVASAATMGEPRPRDLTLSAARAASLRCRPRPIGSVGPHGEASG